MAATQTSERPATAITPERDLTGRSRLVSNVLFVWAGQMVFFVAGFILPRLIDNKLGQEVLGVWDFSWSLVTYFGFVDMGIMSSVNRYVARHWGKQDIEGVNCVLSSATAVLFVAGFLVLLATAVVVVTLPVWFGERLNHDYVVITQKSVFCLGVMLSVGTALGAYNGVLTGCHRWELQSIRNSSWRFIAAVSMIIALWLGAGLVTLAAITAVCEILSCLTLVTLAYRVCPGLQLSYSHARWGTIKELYIYGGKALIPTISEMLLNQTTSVLIIGALGPAALALFTRPRSLLRQMDTLERKMAMILTPTTSSLDVFGHLDEIERLLIKSVRYSVYLTLPLVLVLVIFGGAVLRLWMGPNYANWILPAILAIGFLGTSIQTPILSMLQGLNAHGRAGLGQLIGSVLSAGAVFISLKFLHSGLAGAAVAVTVPLLLVNLIYLPMLLCRRLGHGLGEFYHQVAVRPMLHVLPFAVALVIGRQIFKTYPVPALAICAIGGLVLAISYWRSVLPHKLKIALRDHWEKLGSWARVTGVGGTQIG